MLGERLLRQWVLQERIPIPPLHFGRGRAGTRGVGRCPLFPRVCFVRGNEAVLGCVSSIQSIVGWGDIPANRRSLSQTFLLWRNHRDLSELDLFWLPTRADEVTRGREFGTGAGAAEPVLVGFVSLGLCLPTPSLASAAPRPFCPCWAGFGSLVTASWGCACPCAGRG